MTTRKLYREMTKEELLAELKTAEAQSLAEYKAWMKCSKETLLAEVSQRYRVHAMSLRDSKGDLTRAILGSGIHCTIRLIEKNLKKFEEA